MKRFQLYFLLLFLMNAPFGMAQIEVTNEDKDLAFQNHFFEALKQKAIQNYSKAIESLEKCYEIDSTQMAVAFELSQNFLKLKRYFEAEQFINKALLKDADNEYLLLHKSEIYKDIGNLEQAIIIQQELAIRFPKYNQLLLELYIQSKRYDEAEKLIDAMESKAISTSKTKILKQFLENRMQSTVKTTAKEKEMAPTLESLKRSFESSKNFNDLKQLLIVQKNKELFEMMAADSKQGIALFPAQPFLYLMHAKAQFALGKYNEAISVLGIGIDFVIDDPTMEFDYYEEFARNYEQLNDTINALKYRQKAAKIRQKNK